MTAQEQPQDQETTIRSSEPLFGFLEGDQAVLVFLNGVEVIQSNRRLTGETLVLVMAERQDSPPPAPAGGALLVKNSRIQEIYLEGNVSIEEGDEKILGASLFYADNRSGTAWIQDGESRSRTSSSPLIIRFDQMRKFADGTRSLEGLKYTTCDYQHLHWYVSTPLATITSSPEGDILQTSDNTVRVAGIPVFWWPGITVNLDDHDLLLKKISLGDSSRLGSELKTVWGGDADNLATSLGAALGHNKPMKGSWELGASLYGKRGLFLEPSFEYSGPEMKGSTLFSFINDSANRDHLDQVIGDKTRGRLRVQHRSWLSREDFDNFSIVDVEVSYLSDRNYLNEYYEHEFKTGKEQETYVRYESVREDEAITVLARGRLNDFDTQVQYYPEIQRRISAQPTTKPWLFGGLLTIRDILSQALLAPDKDQPAVSSERNLRAGRRVQVDWPFDLEGGDRVLLTAGIDLMYFDKTNGQGSEEVRRALLPGLSWSRTYAGVDSDRRSDAWNLHGIRHIVEPRIEYSDIAAMNLEPPDLLSIDDLENLTPTRTINVGFRHRVQTHQEGEIVTLLDTDILLPFFPREDRDNAGEVEGDIVLDTRWTPRARINGLQDAVIRWRARLNPHDSGYEESYLSYINQLDVDHRYVVSSSKARHAFNWATVGLETTLTPRWSLGTYFQKDMRLNEDAKVSLLLRQAAHRWFIDYIFEEKRGTGIGTGADKDESSFSIRFTPAYRIHNDDGVLDKHGLWAY